VVLSSNFVGVAFLWVWLLFTPKRYHLTDTDLSWLNTLNCTMKAPAVDLLRVNTLEEEVPL